MKPHADPRFMRRRDLQRYLQTRACPSDLPRGPGSQTHADLTPSATSGTSATNAASATGGASGPAQGIDHSEVSSPKRPPHDPSLSDHPKGLGDSLAQLIERTGLASLAHWYTHVTGRDCNCDRRQAALNRLFPYHQQGD